MEDVDPAPFATGQPISTMANISQIRLTNGENFLIMATNDPGKPGCIRVCHFPLTNKVQALVEEWLRNHRPATSSPYLFPGTSADSTHTETIRAKFDRMMLVMRNCKLLSS